MCTRRRRADRTSRCRQNPARAAKRADGEFGRPPRRHVTTRPSPEKRRSVEATKRRNDNGGDGGSDSGSRFSGFPWHVCAAHRAIGQPRCFLAGRLAPRTIIYQPFLGISLGALCDAAWAGPRWRGQWPSPRGQRLRARPSGLVLGRASRALRGRTTLLLFPCDAVR